MRSLIIGFLILLGWSAFSTYVYVCKIKGFCNEPVALQTDSLYPIEVISFDTLTKPAVQKMEIVPDSLFIYFAFDRSDFESDAKTDKYVEESNIFLNQNSQAMISITGHTDAIGSDEYNQALGYRRAQSMQIYFESMGLPSNKIRIESKGEKEPADDNNRATGRANNRRTVISIKH